MTEPCALGQGRGAMVTLVRGGGVGYAATNDLSDAELRAACARAAVQGRLGLFDATLYPRSAARLSYRSPVVEPWEAMPFSAKLDLLQGACDALAIDERIVDWAAWLGHWRQTQLRVTSEGIRDRKSNRTGGGSRLKPGGT